MEMTFIINGRLRTVTADDAVAGLELANALAHDRTAPNGLTSDHASTSAWQIKQDYPDSTD
jgi:hypothetical protein